MGDADLAGFHREHDRSLQQLAQDRWRILGRRVRGEKALRAIIEEENADMARDLRRVRAREQALLQLVATAEPETLLVTSADTIWADIGVKEYVLEFEGVTVKALVDTSGIRSASISYKALTATAVIYRRPDRSWWADLELSGPYQVSELRVVVNDPGLSWWDRNKFWVGAGTGAVVIAALVFLLGGAG